MDLQQDNLSIVVVGASGDLARTKVVPAFFALFCQGLLPERFYLFGFARTDLTHESFRNLLREKLSCRYSPGESCGRQMDAFLSRCHYVRGDYASAGSYLDLYELMKEVEGSHTADRLFYLAVPPLVFIGTARALGEAGFVRCAVPRPWSRVVVEKPFGRDRESSDVLLRELGEVFTEEQVFRIDHYLGKEVIQNLLVLRFANLVFEPVWNARCVQSVRITWKETEGVRDRGGYFDAYGVIRDVVQNHLLQILALTAMEPPARIDASCIRDEKVRVLRSIPPVTPSRIVLGQYGGAEGHPAYRQEKGVPSASATPTYAAVALRVDNPRWTGVPFYIEAGKALDEHKTEIRLQFREVGGSMFSHLGGCPPPNALVIRVQPDESIHFEIVSKVPGLSLSLASRKLDLNYRAAFTQTIPEAYESLLLDAIRGDKSLFIRDDELSAAWDIFTPVLGVIDRGGVPVELYDNGGKGPPAGAALLSDGLDGATVTSDFR